LLQRLLFALKARASHGVAKENYNTFVPHCFTRPGKTTTPALQVLVYCTILLLNISMDMPSLQNRSNCMFRCVFLRLATTTTAKSGVKKASDKAL